MAKKVHAAHILVKDEKKANELKAKIEGGEDFATLAKKWSSCPSKKKGGDLGWFAKGDMVPEFDAVCFTANPGDLSVCKTEFGWHVIKVLETK